MFHQIRVKHLHIPLALPSPLLQYVNVKVHVHISGVALKLMMSFHCNTWDEAVECLSLHFAYDVNVLFIYWVMQTRLRFWLQRNVVWVTVIYNYVLPSHNVNVPLTESEATLLEELVTLR